MSQAAPSPSRNVRITAFLIAAGVLLAVAAAVVGISDNPPGLGLAYGAGAAFTLALAHPWREPRRWFRLLVGSFLSGFACAILHNFPEVVSQRMGEGSALGSVLGVVGVTLFLLAVLVAPPVIVVSLGGLFVTSIRQRFAARPAAGS